jgi:dTDP-4-amino-4,6-dideoxygalactose transaminase
MVAFLNPVTVHSSFMLQSAPGTVAPCASITPILRAGSLRAFGRSRLATLLDNDRAMLTTSGRAALALALQALAIGPGHEVLIPAYHCLALSAPILASRASAVSYRVTGDLSLDFEDLIRRVTGRTRCIVVVHFFGFAQPLTRIREFCDQAGIALIEDCAHAFYGGSEGAPIGRLGDFAIGSLMKFFPLFDGGCLVSFRRAIPRPVLHGRGLVFQVKALIHVLERSARWSRSRLLRAGIAALLRAGALAKRASPRLSEQLVNAAPAAVFGSVDFEEKWVHARMSTISQLLVRFANHERAIVRRQQHYRKYVSALGNVVGGAPLRADLPGGVVPYVFPFLLANAQTFAALQAAGVPMYRWEDVDSSTCAITRHYQTHLVQFPCHQDLRDDELDTLIGRIRRVLETSPDRSNDLGEAASCA